MVNDMERRDFVRMTVAGTLATGSAPLLWGNSNRWQGANDRVRIAVVGIHGMGQSHIKEFSSIPNVEVAALCDVDENLYAEVVKTHFTGQGRPKPKLYPDLRLLYEDKEIDAVTIVTPNHWHTLAAIWAMQAGKHVTVEKPVSHNFIEGQKLVEAAAKYKVIVQHGLEQRSNPCAQTAVEFLRSGAMGEVYMAKGLCYKWRDTIGHHEDEPVPPGVHYDLWLGPAPSRPFNRNRFHYNWHWNWDYGCGDIGNQGVHELDIARWGLGVTLPTRISTSGAHFLFNDDQQTPNVLMALFEFDAPAPAGDRKKILQFEVRGWITNREAGLGEERSEGAPGGYMISDENTIGNIFYGSGGYMVKDVNSWWTYLGRKREPGPSGKGLGNHYLNFIDAIRANNQALINGTMADAHYSAALAHLANISYRLGRSLNFDPKTGQFVGDDEADKMLRREYRAPFVVPDKV
jgi:predicted dehydrogenase